MSQNGVGWQTVHSVSSKPGKADRFFVNVVPMYGKAHVLTPACWCEPEVVHDSDYEDDVDVLIHESAQ